MVGNPRSLSAGPPSDSYLARIRAGHDVGTGRGGKEDLAACEVLAETLTGRVAPRRPWVRVGRYHRRRRPKPRLIAASASDSGVAAATGRKG